MNPPITTDIALCLHPAAIEAIPGYDDSTKYLVSEARLALTLAYEGVAAVQAAYKHTEGNQALSASARTLVLADLADMHAAKITAKLDSTILNLNHTIAVAEELLMDSNERAAVKGFMANVFNHVRAMKRAVRLTFICGVMGQADLTAFSKKPALAPFLSGVVDPEERTHALAFPTDKQRHLARCLDVMKAALSLLYKATFLIFDDFEKAIGADLPKVTALRIAKLNADMTRSICT